MATSYDPDDLLSPKLTEADDAVGFDRPWNPWSLVTLTFFFGLLAGGGLLAFNFDRLGMPGRRLPTLALVVGVTTAGILALSWATGSGLVPAGDRGAQRSARWVVRAVFVLVAITIAARQRPRFRLYEMSGDPPGGLWKPGAAAGAISLLYHLVIGWIGTMLFRN